MPKKSISYLFIILLITIGKFIMAGEGAKESKMGYDGGFYVQSSDGNFKLKFNANMQLRYEYQIVESGRDTNTFSFPRTRLIFTGNAFDPKLTYMFMPEMGDYDQGVNTGTAGGSALTGNSANIYMRDIWFNYAFRDEFQIKLGQFFMPRHRQAYTISPNMQFGEFPITALSDFAFVWDRGIDVHGTVSKLDYDAVLTNGTGGNLTNVSKGMNVGTRVVYNIFGKYGYSESDIENSADPNLAVGGQISFNNNDKYNKAATAPGGTNPDYLLTSADIALKHRGFSFEAEFMNLRNYAGVDTNNPAFTVQAGYFLIPKKFELAGEVSRIFWDGSDNDQSEYVAGASYYFKGHKLKIQGTYSLLIDEDGNGTVGNGFTAVGNEQVNHRFRTLFGFAF